jgi:cytochrome P450
VLTELRAELHASPLPIGAPENEPLNQDALAALDRLLLLDAVVRETMRLYAPVPSTIHEAVQDAALPLAAPLTDRHGVQHHEIRCAPAPPLLSPTALTSRHRRLAKGSPCSSRFCASTTRQNSGARTREWRPARWLADGPSDGTPTAVHDIPGVWGHVLTFRSGPHVYAGFQFSLVECVLLFRCTDGVGS